jgi:hypothetical protein
MVREAVAAVLAEPAYRQAAERMRDEIAALPEPAYTVTLLERLAAEWGSNSKYDQDWTSLGQQPIAYRAVLA